MRTTARRARLVPAAKADSIHSLRAGAIWGALPQRDQNLLVWLLSGDIVTARLAALLVYGQLRIAQRRLARLVELGLLRGFWTASAQRPRGRYAYTLTRATRLDIEALAWSQGLREQRLELSGSPPIHQLAIHDLFEAFLMAGDTSVPEGIVAWVPERACSHLFGGFVRPDALAVVRFGHRAAAIFIERDLGTERGEIVAEKIRRYRSVFARDPDVGAHVGFVVESSRRAHSVLELAARDAGGGDRVTFLTTVDVRLRADPLGAPWSDGRVKRSLRDLANSSPIDQPILMPRCLLDADAIAALDDRALGMVPTTDARMVSPVPRPPPDR